jgi:capsular polysaccharide biosynthesis protein
MDQDPPNIIQSGYADGEPVSPSIIKNTIIGGIIGFFLAIAIIVMSYLFNDTIVTAEDAEKKLGLNVLGTLPLEASDEEQAARKNKKKKQKQTQKKK